jgi:hypothetical protein
LVKVHGSFISAGEKGDIAEAVGEITNSFEILLRQYAQWVTEDSKVGPTEFIRWVETKVIEDYFVVDMVSSTRPDVVADVEKAVATSVGLAATCVGPPFSEGFVSRFAALKVLAPLLTDVRSVTPLDQPLKFLLAHRTLYILWFIGVRCTPGITMIGGNMTLQGDIYMHGCTNCDHILVDRVIGASAEYREIVSV